MRIGFRPDCWRGEGPVRAKTERFNKHIVEGKSGIKQAIIRRCTRGAYPVRAISPRRRACSFASVPRNKTLKVNPPVIHQSFILAMIAVFLFFPSAAVIPFPFNLAGVVLFLFGGLPRDIGDEALPSDGHADAAAEYAEHVAPGRCLLLHEKAHVAGHRHRLAGTCGGDERARQFPLPIPLSPHHGSGVRPAGGGCT